MNSPESAKLLDDLFASSKAEQGRRLIDTIRTDPELVVFIGDTIHDHEVALELGCGCVLMEGGHQSAQRLRQRNCSVVSSPAGLMSLSCLRG